MSYEQSHTFGKKTNPARKRKNKNAEDIGREEIQPQPIGAPPKSLELQDHRCAKEMQPLAAGFRNDAYLSDNVATVADRLRSPTSSD